MYFIESLERMILNSLNTIMFDCKFRFLYFSLNIAYFYKCILNKIMLYSIALIEYVIKIK